MALCRVTSEVRNVLLTLEKEVEGRWPERVQHGKVERCLLVCQGGRVCGEGRPAAVWSRTKSRAFRNEVAGLVLGK